MFEPAEMRRAVEMQRRSYRLLRWMASGVVQGMIHSQAQAVHRCTELPSAAEAWMREHYLEIPQNARPDRDNLAPFAQFFATYLKNSFVLDSNPRRMRYSPGAHCFCPICSWMIAAPHLQTISLTRQHKRYADQLMVRATVQLAAAQQIVVDEAFVRSWIQEQPQREWGAILAYGVDLLLRMQGYAEGPAVLALWRRFAWTPQGSPKPKFRLSDKLILKAEQQFVAALLALPE